MTEDHQDIDKLLEDLLREPTWRKKLLACVDRNKRLSERNFVEPYELLIYEETTETIESVSLKDLAVRYPWGWKGCRWNAEDVGLILRAKLTLCRQSVVANELAADGVANKNWGTVVLCIPEDADLPFSWIEVRSWT